jgi:ABC-type uncharacterized transport system permease subunit
MLLAGAGTGVAAPMAVAAAPADSVAAQAAPAFAPVVVAASLAATPATSVAVGTNHVVCTKPRASIDAFVLIK